MGDQVLHPYRPASRSVVVIDTLIPYGFRLLLFLLLLLLLLLFVITFIEGIYSYVPETSPVSRVYSVAAILWSQFMLRVMLVGMLNGLYFYNSTSRSVCAVPSVAVSCSSLISCFSCM
jgi:hypothetical protein